MQLYLPIRVTRQVQRNLFDFTAFPKLLFISRPYISSSMNTLHTSRYCPHHFVFKRLYFILLSHSDRPHFSPIYSTKVSQKVKGLFKKEKNIYCKYTETKPILLFNVINVTMTHSTVHYTKPAVRVRAVLPPYRARN